MKTKIHTGVRLTEQQFAFVKAQADELGISISDMIRRIIDQWRATGHG